MTLYAVTFTATGSGSAIPVTYTVTAGSYPVRIGSNGVLTYGYLYQEITFSLGYFTGAPTGGASVTSVPMTQGSPASSATARSGATLPGTTSTAWNYYNWGLASGGAYSVQLPLPYDLIVAPGSTFFFDGSVYTSTNAPAYTNIYFEELRLSWNY